MARIGGQTISTSPQLIVQKTAYRGRSRNAERLTAWEVIRTLLPFSECKTGREGLEAASSLVDAWCNSDSQWQSLASEAEYHGVAPLLAPLIINRCDSDFCSGGNVGSRIFIALAARHRRAAATREVCIDELLDAFSASKIQILLLKGAALGHCLYGSPNRRAARDIDVLINPDDEGRIINVIRDLGYTFLLNHDSGFARRHHHLSPATMERDGFTIALEIHRDAISLDQPYRLTLQDLTQSARPLDRGKGPPGLTLGHVDMLHHLARHAFEPAATLRLIHLFDLYCYRNKFHDEIDWKSLRQSHPHVCVVLELVDSIFSADYDASAREPAGVATGMLPLTEIWSANCGLITKLNMLLNPSPWWLHGYYGIAPTHSLLSCRAVRHPATVIRWLGRRLAARIAVANA